MSRFAPPLLLALPLLLCGFTESQAPVHDFEFGFESQVYQYPIEPVFFPVLSAGMNLSSGNGKAMKGDSETEYQVDAKFRISPLHPSAFAVTGRNLYWGQKDHGDSPVKFTIGRRLVNWSKIDQLWQVGQFELLDQWDRLRPDTQGLIGAFAYAETETLAFRVFASGLFLPESSPNVVIENQRFLPEHPQAISSAPQTFNLLDQSIPAAYSLEIPSYASILLRPSFAASIETRPSLPFRLKASYGYLPLNYFPIALQGTLAIALNQVQVNLRPRVISHSIAAGDLGYRATQQVTLGVAGVFDQPVEEVLPVDYTTTPLTNSLSISPYLEYQDPANQLMITYLFVSGGLDADVGPAKQDGASLFSSHLFYRSAAQAKASRRLALNSKMDPTVSLKYIHEFSIRGDWISGDFLLKLKPGLTLTLGGDILSSYLDVSPDRGAEFLADMRALGRARMGVSYVF